MRREQEEQKLYEILEAIMKTQGIALPWRPSDISVALMETRALLSIREAHC